MSEANQNNTSFNSEPILPHQNDLSANESSDRQKQPDQIADVVNQPGSTNNSFSDSSQGDNPESPTSKMDWQKVAHKLREYNRKLLKKVFRLEQEVAEVDNKYNKYVEKSQNSDLLLAHQAEEIKEYQDKVNLFAQQLQDSQEQVDEQKLIIQQLSEQDQLSQKQAAQLERECTLLQEKYNHKAFELVTKEQENQELQSKLNQQERNALQREAELKRYQDAATRKEKMTSRHQNYPHNRYIQPWSNSTIPEKITLPRNKSQSAKAATYNKSADAIKTAAEIATWSVTATSPTKQGDKSKTVKSSQSKKPQTLAAVDLPTFPRPQ